MSRLKHLEIFESFPGNEMERNEYNLRNLNIIAKKMHPVELIVNGKPTEAHLGNSRTAPTIERDVYDVKYQSDPYYISADTLLRVVAEDNTVKVSRDKNVTFNLQTAYDILDNFILAKDFCEKVNTRSITELEGILKGMVDNVDPDYSFEEVTIN